MTKNGSHHRAVPELSIDAQTLQKRLHQAHLNGHPEVSYSELSSLIGRNVQAAARGVLQTARNREARECDVLFAPVVGVGMKALDDSGVVGEGKRKLEHIHRTARRGARELTGCVKQFATLSSDLQLQHNLQVSVLAVIANRSSSPALKKLGTKITGVLPLAKCLDAMRETL